MLHGYIPNCFTSIVLLFQFELQGVLLATEPGISLKILTPMKILQWNLNRSTFVVWESKRNVSVVRFEFRYNILISGKIIKEMPGSVASGSHCTFIRRKERSIFSLSPCLIMCFRASDFMWVFVLPISELEIFYRYLRILARVLTSFEVTCVP